MLRHLCLITVLLSGVLCARAVVVTVVADSATHTLLPNAPVYDRHGKIIGASDSRGRLPILTQSSYPLTIAYLGKRDVILTEPFDGTVFMADDLSELPEVRVDGRSPKVLHILAYVREYTTLTTYTDTIFLLREKMVDYILPDGPKIKFEGWSSPRTLTSRSFYHFTNSLGLDSVSDTNHLHFSWSDWMALPPARDIPQAISCKPTASHQLPGRFNPSELWSRDSDTITVNVSVLDADSARLWVPTFNAFFRSQLDFESFRTSYRYTAADETRLLPVNLDRYTFHISSVGRGRDMFMFNHVDQPVFVETDTEFYIIDREYITVKEARKWDKRQFDLNQAGLYVPYNVPEYSPSMQQLISRVEAIDRDQLRLSASADQKYVDPNYNPYGNKNFRLGSRALAILKNLTGITAYKTKRHNDRSWSETRRRQLDRNRQNTQP